MSFAEWSNNKQRKTDYNNNSVIIEKNNNISGKPSSFSEWSNRKIASSVNVDYINTFISDYNNFLTSAEKDYENINFGNASSVSQKYISTANDLKRRASHIKDYLDINKNSLAVENYNQILNIANFGDENATKILDSFKEIEKYFSSWSTERDYDNWFLNNSDTEDEGSKTKRQDIYKSNKERIAELDKKIKNFKFENKGSFKFAYNPDSNVPLPSYEVTATNQSDYDALVNEKKKLEDANRLYERFAKGNDEIYSKYLTADDFEEKSGYASRNELLESWKDPNEWDSVGCYQKFLDFYHKGPKLEDHLYTATGRPDLNGEKMADEYWRQARNNGWYLATENEYKTLNYVANTQGDDAAQEYFDKLSLELSRRRYNDENKKSAEEYKNADWLKKVGMNIEAVGQSVFGALNSGIGTGIGLLTDSYDPYDFATSELTRRANATYENTANELNELTNNGEFLGVTLGDAYQAGMSGVSSAAGALMFGSAYPVIMGMGAAADTAKDLYERGASEQQMALGGVLAGTAEMVFEKVSIEYFLKNFIKSPTENFGQWFLKSLAQRGIEMSEETATELANIMSDTFVMGDQSEWAQLLKSYKNSGCTDSEAISKALIDMGGQVWKAGAGGFISGGSMSDIAGGISLIKNSKNKSRQKNRDVPLNTNAVTNPIESYPVEKQSTIKSFINAVDENIKSFVQRVKSGDLSVHRQKISDVSARAAADIKKLLGIDTQGYTHNINTNGIQHILKRHGVNGQQNNTMSSDDDIARVGWVLENYDSVEILTKDGQQVYSSEFIDSDGKAVPQIMFTKKINGTYYVVEAAFENKHNKIWVQTAYLTKNKEDVTQTASVNNDRDTNARSASASPSSNNTVPRNTGIVNNNISKNGGDNTENSVSQLTAEGTDGEKLETMSFDNDEAGVGEPLSHEQKVILNTRGEDHTLTNKQRALNRIAEKLGVKLVWDIDGDPALYVNGYYENGVIHMNKQAKAKATVFAHEYIHHIEQSKLWPAFKKFIEGTEAYKNWITLRGNNSDVEQATKNYKERLKTNYKKAGKELTDSDIIANFMAERFFGGDFEGNVEAEAGAESLLREFAKNDKWYHSIIRFARQMISHFKGDKIQEEFYKMEGILLKARKEVQKNTPTDTGGRKYSVGNETVTVDMGETERYEILKNKKIQPQGIEVDKDFDIDFKFLEENIKSIVEKPLIKKLRELGYLKNYSTNVIDVNFDLTSGGVRKSLHSQVSDYGGNFADFAKVILNLQKLLDNSVVLEIHTDKGKGTSQQNAQLKQTYVLLSAFREGTSISPVQFEVKQYVDDSNRLYLAVALTKIETGVMGNTTLDESQASTYLLPVSNISISELFSKINPKDENFLKYVPNQFLNGEQIKAKNRALEKDAIKYSRKNSVTPASEAETIARLAAEGRADEYKTDNTVSKLDAERVADRWLKENKSSFDKAELTANINRMIELSNSSAWGDVINLAKETAKKLSENSERKRSAASLNDLTMGIFSEIVNNRESVRLSDLAQLEAENAQYRRKLSNAENDNKRKTEQLNKQRQEVKREVEMERAEYADRVKNRERIRRAVRSLDSKLRTNSNVKHVPEGLQGAIRDFCGLFLANDKATFKRKDLADLYVAYSALGDDSSAETAGGYSEYIQEIIKTAASILDGKSLPQLNDSDLVMLRDITENLLHIVNSQNEMFINGRKATLEKVGTAALHELQDMESKKDIRLPGGDKVNTTKDEAARFFGTGNLKPIYFFEKLGSTFKKMFDDMLNGQYECVNHLEAAQTFAQQTLKDSNYWRWIEDGPVEIKLEQGGRIKLTKGQAMALYATWKREQTNAVQKAQHLYLGGIVLNDKQVTKKITKNGKEGLINWQEWVTKAHKLTPQDMQAVIDSLTGEQINFVDTMISYLSDDMASLGNKVTMELYGIKRFKEDYYFPYKTAENFRPNEANGKKKETKLKNSSFTKQTVEKANTPIVVEDFLETWAKHVAEMCQYSTMTLPIENMSRVFGFRMSPDDNYTAQAVRAEVQRVAGKEGVQYVQQLIDDLNGGLVSLPGDKWYQIAVSKFKKNAVFASASVVVQQPSAICRAFSVIDPKYFVKTTLKVAERNYSELKKYCPVAILKEMGRFDVGTGSQLAEWIIRRSYDGIKEKGKAFFADSEYRDDKMSAAAAKADEMTWAHIWAAAKAQTAATKNINVGSEEFYNAAATLFNEAVEKTQVYDSVLTRSENMRSKSSFTQMATAFMAEPTTTLNMLWDATNEIKNHNVKAAGKIVGSVVCSILFNAILKSFVTAARDDDEEKSYAEKYLQEVIANFTGDIGIWNMIPVVKDAASIFEGYTVDRTDVSLVEDLVKGVKALSSDNYTDWEKFKSVIGPIAAFFGLPVKNVIRDAEAAWNMVVSFIEGRIFASGTEMKYAALGALPWGDDSSSHYYELLYEAQHIGDEERYQEIYDYLISKGKDESAIRSGIRKFYRESKEIQRQMESYEEKIVRMTYYNKLEEDKKKNVLTRIRTYLVDKAISQDTGEELSDASKKAALAEEKGANAAVYMLASAGFEDTDNSGGISKAEKIAAINKMDISQTEKIILISMYTDTSKKKNSNN